jgi:hypothetical protein
LTQEWEREACDREISTQSGRTSEGYRRLLDIERSALDQGSAQPLSIGVTTFDTSGNQQHLVVRNTWPGANSIQQIHDLGDGYNDQALIERCRGPA